MRTVVVPPRAAEGPTAPASSYDLGQKVRAAVACGVFVGIGLAVVAGVLLLPMGEWEAWLWSVVGSLVAGILVTCRLGYVWVVKAASRPWEVDDQIRQRIWKREDLEREEARAAAEAAREDITHGDLDHDRDPTTLNDAQRLHLVALEVLERAYLHDLLVTREAMTAEGLCSQPEWNAVNSLMKAVGLKRGYTLRGDLDFVGALQAWRSGVRLDGDRAWVKTGKGQEVLVELG